MSIVLAIVGFAVGGCGEDDTAPKLVGSGVAKTETRAVPNFERVNLYGEGRLELGVGALSPLTITADDNILPILTTVVEGTTLSIRPSQENVSFKTPLVIRGSSPKLAAVDCFGSGDVVVRDLQGTDFNLSVVGSGRVKASGSAASITISIKGAGTVDTSELKADRVTVDITGAGHADVNAAKSLDVNITGAASVRYSGDPQVTKQISGIGTIEKK